MKRFNRRSNQRSLELGELFHGTAAGIQISGDSGSGKSNLIALIARTLVRAGHGFALIDPDGDLAADIAAECSSLPPRFRRRVLEVKLCDLRRGVSINPLAVPGSRQDHHAYRARRAAKVSHVRQIILGALGEGEQGIVSRPQLAKLTDVYLNTLADCGLTIPDIELFFNVRAPEYSVLARSALDMLAQLELEMLADLRPREREELIASTKNRFHGFLQNPIVHTTLGSVEPGRVLDMRRVIREGTILIINLERGGVLRDEDVQVFANLFLHEILYAVFNMPRDERVPFFLILDELPDFQSCGPLLIRALRHVRKYHLRLVGAHQGTQFFAERQQDRLLHAFVAQCKLHYYFSHADPVDAKFFGEIIKLPLLNSRRVKHVLRQEQQYQDGHERVVLTDESENWGDSDTVGTADSQSTSATSTDATGASEAIRDLLGTATEAVQQLVTANTNSHAEAHGLTQGSTRNQSHATSRGGSRTKRTTLVPRIRNRLVVTGVQFLSIDEQNVEGAVELSRLPVGTAIEYRSGRPYEKVQFPLAENPLRRTPRFARKKLSEFDAELARRPEYASPAEILAARQRFRQQLLAQLEAAPAVTSVAPVPRIMNVANNTPFGI